MKKYLSSFTAFVLTVKSTIDNTGGGPSRCDKIKKRSEAMLQASEYDPEKYINELNFPDSSEHITVWLE